VFTVGSFIYDLAVDTPESIKDLHRFYLDLDLHYSFFIPLTPLPGTPYWNKEMWDPTGERFRRFGFLPGPPVSGNGSAFDRALISANLCNWNRARIRGWLRGIYRRCGHPLFSIGIVGVQDFQQFLENIAGINTGLWELLVSRQSRGQEFRRKARPDPGFSVSARFGEGHLHECHHGFGQARLAR